MRGSAEDLTLQALVTRYLHALATEQRASVHTVTAAQRDLSSFLEHCQRASVLSPAAIDGHQIRTWMTRLHRDGHQPVSLHRYLASLRGWFRWLIDQGVAHANPATAVRAPRFRRKLPQIIPADSLGPALDQPAITPVEVRDRAMVEVLYSTGLRLSELHALDVDTVADGQTEMRVIGKGNKERLVWLGSKARTALDDWLAVRRGWIRRPEPALFLNPRGGRLSRTGIGLALKAWARRTELDAHLHPHRLRHAFATHLLEDAGDLRAVQDLLGHAHLATTQIYTQVDFRRLAEVYDQAHPRARKAPGKGSA